MPRASTRPQPESSRCDAGAPQGLPAELLALGVELGRWETAVRPVSSLPHLTYARDLDALQCRVGAAMTDRVRWHHGQTRADSARTWPEPRDEHTHNEPEVRVVLRGQVDFVVRVAGRDDLIHLLCDAGTWIVLPTGVSHACRPANASAVEMLRLFQRGREAVSNAGRAHPQPLLPARVGRSAPRPWRFAA